MSGSYEVYAFQYAIREAPRSEHFYGGDPSSEIMPMAYFFFLVKNDSCNILIDTGFTPSVAQKRQRTYLADPLNLLQHLRIAPTDVNMVILTHLHYDHTGNIGAFPNATFVVQEEEMRFWTGKMLPYHHFRVFIEIDDVVTLLRANFEGRVRFVNGDAEILPGLSVHRVGGHSPGLQIVRIATERGNLVLASDAAHFYENFEKNRPFSVVVDLREMYLAFDRLRSLADGDLIIPGHDPLIAQRYPVLPDSGGLIVRLA